MPEFFLTRQVHHGGVVFTVRYSCGVCDTVHPEVGIVITGAENHRRTFWDDPVLSGQSGTIQNPATQTGHKATDLHVHHHRSLPHAAGLMSRERKCVEKSYGESGACISERLQVNNEMRLNSDVGLLLLLEPSFCSSQLETGKTTWFDLISSFSLPEGIPMLAQIPSLSRKMVLKNFQCTRTACLMI